VTAIHADETAEAAFLRADRLLYTAKGDGRDRVCTA
jgi:diguanylate cyclase